MAGKIVKTPVKTVITTGERGTVITTVNKPQVSSKTGKIAGGQMVDLMFVFDTTGSMENKIQALLETCVGFADEAGKMNLDLQFILISFGDISIQGGGDRIEIVVPPTSDIEKFKYGLRHIPRNNGFSNVGESVLEAIDIAFKVQYREKAVKVMIIITDEPALNWETKVKKTISTMIQREFLVYVAATDEPYYHEMTTRNGGKWKRIGPDTDFNEILELLKGMIKEVAMTAQKVHLIGKGSVAEYLRLTASK